MSSLFSKLCPFLHAWVMYGDTPLDISCFTTFISVQYLTLCPPSLTWDWPIHADFSIISASPLTDQFSSREILDTILKMTRHHASSFSHFLRHPSHSFMGLSLWCPRSAQGYLDEDERNKKGVFCGVGVTLRYCHLMLQVTLSCSSLTNNKSKQRQHLLQLNSSI